MVTSIEIFRGKDYLDPKNPPKSVKRGSEQTASLYPKVFLQQVVEGKQVLRRELKRRISGPLYEGTLCPYCEGMPRTQLAKQCRHCGRDWHDPDH
jgi:hypothetical protein